MAHPARALLLAALLLAVRGAAAEEPAEESPVAAYHRALAGPNLRVANWCWGRGLKNLGRAMDRAILRLDPGERQSRLRLGYVLVDGTWKAPSKALPEVKDDWTRARLRDYWKIRSEALAESASISASEARRREAAGDEGGAKEAWYDALRLDPVHEGARSALDYGTLDVTWFGSRIRSRAERESWLGFHVRGKAFLAIPWSDGAEVRKSLGQDAFTGGLSQASSSRFIVDSNLKQSHVDIILRYCLKGEAVLEAMGILGPQTERNPVPWNYIMLQDFESYRTFVEWYMPKDPWKRVYYLSLSGFYPEARVFLIHGCTLQHSISTAVHKAAEHLADESCGGRGPVWFTEGAAFVAVEAAEIEGARWCVEQGASGVDFDRLGKPEEWGALLVEDMASGRTHSLDRLFRMTIKDMDQAALLQSWSFLWWVREVDPKRLGVLLGHLTGGSDPETALLNAFGCPGSVVERAWSDWALSQWLPEKK